MLGPEMSPFIPAVSSRQRQNEAIAYPYKDADIQYVLNSSWLILSLLSYTYNSLLAIDISACP